MNFTGKVKTRTIFSSQVLGCGITLGITCVQAVVTELEKRKKNTFSTPYLHFREAVMNLNPGIKGADLKELWSELQTKGVEELKILLSQMRKENNHSKG